MTESRKIQTPKRKRLKKLSIGETQALHKRLASGERLQEGEEYDVTDWFTYLFVEALQTHAIDIISGKVLKVLPRDD